LVQTLGIAGFLEVIMTFPGNGTPFGASALIIFALVVVILIILFAVLFGAYLIFSGTKEQGKLGDGGNEASQLTGRRS